MSISAFLFEKFAGLLFDRHTDPNDHCRNVLLGAIRGYFFHFLSRRKMCDLENFKLANIALNLLKHAMRGLIPADVWDF